MGSWAQNSSGVRWCRRRVRFNEVPEKVPEKVPGSLGAKPSQVHQGSGEGSGEGLGGYLVQARRVLQGSANSCPIDAPVFSWACFFFPCMCFFLQVWDMPDFDIFPWARHSGQLHWVMDLPGLLLQYLQALRAWGDDEPLHRCLQPAGSMRCTYTWVYCRWEKPQGAHCGATSSWGVSISL